MTADQGIMAELQAVGGVIARAEAGLVAGSLLDLAPLESLIEDLCRRIEDLPATEGRKVQPKLLALVDDFGRLGGAIEIKMAALKAEMGEVAGRRAAVSAYSKSSATRE